MLKIVMVMIGIALLACPASFAMCGSCDAGGKSAGTITGRIDSSDPVDPERGDTQGNIIIREGSGKELSCLITPDTKVLDASSKAIASADLEDGATAKVDYIQTDEGPVATAVTLTKNA